MNLAEDFPTSVPQGALCVIKVDGVERLYTKENEIWVDVVTKKPLPSDAKISVPSQGYADRFGTE